MAKYTVKCSDCGCDFQVQLFGPTKQRDWMLEHKEWLCEDCYAKMKEEQRLQKEQEHNIENQKNAENNAKKQLPALQGTPKQIAWAETLRAKRIEELDSRKGGEYTDLELRIRHEIEAQNDSSWWIDNRNISLESLCEKIFEIVATNDEKVEYYTFKAKEFEKYLNQSGILGATAKAYAKKVEQYKTAETGKIEVVKKEIVSSVKIMEPEEVKHKEVAYVKENSIEKKVVVYSERDENVRLLLKAAGFVWEDGAWRRTGGLYRYASDYALAMLLKNGHRVSVEQEIQNRFSDKVFTRFVCLNLQTGNFLLVWWDKTQDWFKEAKHLPKAKWNNGMNVPKEYASEVQDFAQINGFCITDSALKLIEAQKKAIVCVDVPNVVKAKEVELPEATGQVIDSLKDND